MKGKAKQRKMRVKLGDEWFATRPRKLLRIWDHPAGFQVIEYVIEL